MTAMEGWKAGKLGGLCSIEIGGTPSRSNPDYWDSAKETTNRWVSIRDLNKRVVSDTAEHITNFGARHSNVKLQKTGTVLLSFKLSIGRVAFAGCDLYTNEAIAGLCSEELDSEFLFYGLQQWDLLQNVDQAIKGATLNKEKLKQIEFQYPVSREVQTHIASILSTLDRAIEQTEAIIAKQQRIKAGLMQDLLTKGIDEHGVIRSEATHQFKDSQLGRIPVEWEIEPLGKVAILVTSGSRGWARFYSTEGAVFLRIGNLTREHINFRFDDVMYVNVPESSEGKRTAVQEGDLLISITADLGIIAVVPEGFPEAYVNQHIALVRLNKDEVYPRFIGHLLNSGVGQTQIEKLNESGAKAGLNLPTIENLKIFRPTYSEQQKIVDILDGVDSQITIDKKRVDKLRRQKAGLMHDLLTGTVRVNLH
ncbi:MAG: restriction endonuclease subunit S [Desulfuromonadaceae bacterium]